MLSSLELFAGAGGSSLGFELAGIKPALLVESDKDACNTLRANRPNWYIHEGNLSYIDFGAYRGYIDVVSGGFPCQPFSFSGKKLGFSDSRGDAFFEFARVLNIVQPKMFMAENVRGFLKHDDGVTMAKALFWFGEHSGYDVQYKLLNSHNYRVPQKRERLIFVGTRKDLTINFQFPVGYPEYTLRDALYKGNLYATDCPISAGQSYSLAKGQVMDLVPPGGNWRALPLDIQKQYMGKGFYSEGGRTGMAKRLSLDEPSPTILCSPAQKQTERCHPLETRPLTIRESARIQTFPDDWKFCGSIAS